MGGRRICADAVLKLKRDGDYTGHCTKQWASRTGHTAACLCPLCRRSTASGGRSRSRCRPPLRAPTKSEDALLDRIACIVAAGGKSRQNRQERACSRELRPRAREVTSHAAVSKSGRPSLHSNMWPTHEASQMLCGQADFPTNENDAATKDARAGTCYDRTWKGHHGQQEPAGCEVLEVAHRTRLLPERGVVVTGAVAAQWFRAPIMEPSGRARAQRRGPQSRGLRRGPAESWNSSTGISSFMRTRTWAHPRAKMVSIAGGRAHRRDGGRRDCLCAAVVGNYHLKADLGQPRVPVLRNRPQHVAALFGRAPLRSCYGAVRGRQRRRTVFGSLGHASRRSALASAWVTGGGALPLAITATQRCAPASARAGHGRRRWCTAVGYHSRTSLCSCQRVRHGQRRRRIHNKGCFLPGVPSHGCTSLCSHYRVVADGGGSAPSTPGRRTTSGASFCRSRQGSSRRGDLPAARSACRDAVGGGVRRVETAAWLRPTPLVPAGLLALRAYAAGALCIRGTFR